MRELVDRLQVGDWKLVRFRGSHRQFRHPVKPGTVTVAGKSSEDAPIGTLLHALKQAGLKRKE